MLLNSLIFWVSKIPITSFTSSTTLFKRDLSTFLTFTCFSISFLPVHPESFAINYIKFNFFPPPNPHFSFFFPPRFQTGHHKSVFPLALPSHFHIFPHYSVGWSGPMSTLFIIIMSHCASRRNKGLRAVWPIIIFLSCATALATSQLFHPALFRSFSTVLLQVVFGLPLTLQPSGVIWYTTCTLFCEDSLY